MGLGFEVAMEKDAPRCAWSTTENKQNGGLVLTYVGDRLIMELAGDTKWDSKCCEGEIMVLFLKFI